MAQLPGPASSVSKKQEDLLAGKKALEEFRRKKAQKAKKAKSASPPVALVGAPETQPSETDKRDLTDSTLVSSSHAHAEDHLKPPGVANNESNNSDIDTSRNANANPSPLANNNYVSSSVLEYSASAGSDGSRIADDRYQDNKDDGGSLSRVPSEIEKSNFLAPQISSVRETDNAFSNSSYPWSFNYAANNTSDPEKDLSLGNSVTSAVFGSYNFSKNSASSFHEDKLNNIGREDNGMVYSPFQESVLSMSSVTDSASGAGQNLFVFPDMGEKKYGDSIPNTGSLNSSFTWTSDHRHTDYIDQISSNYTPPSPPAAGRRSRPSFLDSIKIPKDSSPTVLSGEGNDTSSSNPVDGLGPSVSQQLVNSSVPYGDGRILFNHVRENTQDFFSQKQNEDFAALEQHIEELTQDKFSLQRALDASRALAENLASENSALTDNFNQQGSVVNQLKCELENLQEEIKAQMVELEAVRIEYANVQLECNAADQRAKLLASELIEMEEKSLRVRSNELKLERQLESSQAEISTCRKKLSTLEKDRQDLQSTVNALKEEKKLLESKFRKASAVGKSTNTNKIAHSSKDVSTSTEDLDTAPQPSNPENIDTSLPRDDASNSQLPHDNLLLSLEGSPFTIPSDQLRMIQNINTLIAELSLEKDQLMQALSAESTQSSKLSELNKELTRKLEAQTQRLELLTAQNMANGSSNQSRLSEPSTLQENVTYADEGDEVVERVLGWIMKLFPGGPSRRRASKHL